MLKRILASLGLFTLAFTLLYFADSLPIQDSRIHGPIIKNKNGQSTNWSGYAVFNSGTASDVKGTWVVPSLSCTSTNTYSSAWIGFDGYNNSTVEQTGTEHDCSSGSPSYYAWYEMYPKPGYIVPLTIKAGDTINAEVKFTGRGTFILTLTDVTTGKTYSTTQKSNKAQLASSEWIMEAPWSGGVLPLANFGTANFSNSNTTMNGVTKTISGFTFDRIDMVNSSGAFKDQTSGLNSNGDAFSVTWVSSN